MNAARLLTVSAIVCLAASFAAADDKKSDNAKLIVGKWEVTKADPETVGVGAVVEFFKDGKMKVAGADMTIEGTHKVSGDKVTISFKAGDQENKMEGTYKLKGDKFDITFKMGDNEHTDEIIIKKLDETTLSTTNKEGKAVELTRKK